MKTTLLSILMALLIPTLSQARVDGFNAMITENGKAQQKLREELNEQIHSTRRAQKLYKSEFNDDGGFLQTVNTPTDRGFLTYKKEGAQYRASEEKQMQRIANEISELDAQF